MKKMRVTLFGASLAALLALWGCGSDNRDPSTQPTQVAASQACIACHNGAVSPITGNNIVQAWQRSAHASASGGAGCDDCHHVDGHPQNGAIPPLPSTQVCIQCHTNTVAMTTQVAHFNNLTASYTAFPLNEYAQSLTNPVMGGTLDPSALGPNGERAALGCNGCHNPHDVTSLLPVNQQWAQSGHANRTDDTFSEAGEDFIKSTTCNRCHSATGYRYYVTHGQTAVTKVQLGAYSSAHEVISCNACHTNYSWKRLSSDPNVTTFITYSTPYPRFPNVTKRIPGSTNPSFDIGDTKLCVPCHGGRTGRSGAAFTPATNSSVMTDPHYIMAAGTMYGKLQFTNFTSQAAVLPAIAAIPASTGVQPVSAVSATTYGQSLITSEDITGGVTSFHRRLGTPAINGFNANMTPGKLDSNGPCVTCHMTAGHTLKIDIPETYNQVCINCHTSERGTPLNASNFMELFVDENQEQMFDALELAVTLLTQKYDITLTLADDEAREAGVGGVSDISYLWQDKPIVGNGTAIQTNWTAYLAAHPTLTSAQIYKLKGAMFNILLSYREPASFAHARTLTRRIIYDSIDFLDDGLMNMSVGATAQAFSSAGTGATNPLFGKFVKDIRAFVGNAETPLYGTTTPSMTFINNFDRATGSWVPAPRERP